MGDADVSPPGRERVLSPVHTPLPVVAMERFDATWPPWRLITFLNRSLKGRGLVFGLSQEGGETVVTIYDSAATPEDAADKADG